MQPEQLYWQRVKASQKKHTNSDSTDSNQFKNISQPKRSSRESFLELVHLARQALEKLASVGWCIDRADHNTRHITDVVGADYAVFWHIYSGYNLELLLSSDGGVYIYIGTYSELSHRTIKFQPLTQDDTHINIAIAQLKKLIANPISFQYDDTR